MIRTDSVRCQVARPRVLFGSFCLTVALAVLPAQADTVTNGSFEWPVADATHHLTVYTGASQLLLPWVVASNNLVIVNNAATTTNGRALGAAQEGRQFLASWGSLHSGIGQQVVGLTVGADYAVTYYVSAYAIDWTGPASVRCDMGGISDQFTTICTNAPAGSAASPWFKRSFIVKATAQNMWIFFTLKGDLDRDDPINKRSFATLDNVSVLPAVAPPPPPPSRPFALRNLIGIAIIVVVLGAILIKTLWRPNPPRQ